MQFPRPVFHRHSPPELRVDKLD